MSGSGVGRTVTATRSRGTGEKLYTSLTARADALFELAEAVLCADGPVTSLVELTLLAEHRRGHGAMYDALAAGRVEPERLRCAVASLPLPCGVPEVGPGSLTSGDHWSDMIPTCRCGCCT
jgi:DDE superfamily endonuclease